MQKYLGIYIEQTLIKYAKVSKDHDNWKIESFGIRFLESDLNSTIKRIVEETYSYNTPISINLSNEKYLYFDVFALLNKKDVEATVKTEFEAYCEDKKINKSAFDTRYALVPKDGDKEKFRAINIFTNKIELNRQLQQLDGYKVAKVIPTAIAIGNIAKISKKENQLIVNMEEETTITRIINKQVYEVENLNVGSKEVLEAINKVENSYSKAYEICKNTTIYTVDINLTGEEQPYLQYIIPTIYKIAQRVQEVVSEDDSKYQTVYLTGTLASINNIDLYFQEFLPNVECKILKPSVVDEAAAKINMKEYIEVNSAIALAVAGMGEGIQELNFKKSSTGDKLSQAFAGGGKKNGEKSKININMDFSGKLTAIERWSLRGIAAVLLITIIYIIFSKMLMAQMFNKQTEIQDLIAKQNSEISKVNSNASSLESKISIYQTKTSDLKKISEKNSEIASRKNSIPILLCQLMNAIPDRVQLISIENTTKKSVTIKAKSTNYQQLGYFISTLKIKGILKDVVSSSGSKSGNTITVTIEGELP